MLNNGKENNAGVPPVDYVGATLAVALVPLRV